MKNKYLLLFLLLFSVRLIMDYFLPNDVFEVKRDISKSAGYALIMTGFFWLLQKSKESREDKKTPTV